MNRFKSEKILGDGSFGTVILAEQLQTKEKAILLRKS
jgi:hypothetical protein